MSETQSDYGPKGSSSPYRTRTGAVSRSKDINRRTMMSGDGRERKRGREGGREREREIPTLNTPLSKTFTLSFSHRVQNFPECQTVEQTALSAFAPF